MGHYERVRCDNCNGTGTVGQYSGEGPKQCWACGGSGYKGDVWVEDNGSSSSSSSSGGGGGSSGSDRVDRIIQEGNQYYKAGDYENAISKYTQAINQGNIAHKSVAHKNRAICSRLIHQYDQAIADFNAVLNIGHLEYDVLADIYNDRGEVYQLKGDKEQAVSDWKLAADYGSKEALIGLDVMGIKYTPKAPKSSTSSSSSESGGKGSIIFGIIGAIVCGLIGATIISFLGIGFIGGAIGGWFLGKWLSAKMIGKILIIVALVFAGGTFIINKLPSKPKNESAVTAQANATINANANFRSGPSTDNAVIRQLKQGDTVTLTGETSGNWTQVSHNGEVGWVSAEFLGSSSNAAPAQSESASPAAVAPAATADPAAAADPAAYKIGDTGPAGGIIFYVKNNNSGGWRYLEAAPQDIQGVLRADADRPDVNGNMERSAGSGKTNSAALMRQAASRGGGVGWAVQACDVLEVNGYDDWFLPSRDELNYLYENLHKQKLGNFSNEKYWSSTFDSGVWEWSCIDFSNGQYYALPGADQYRVRACRQF